MTTELAWFTSSYSNDQGGACVEVAVDSRLVHVRDSKDRTGPQLAFEAEDWADFVVFAARQQLR